MGDSEGTTIDVQVAMTQFWQTGHAPQDDGLLEDARVAGRWLEVTCGLPQFVIGYSFGAYAATTAVGPRLDTVLVNHLGTLRLALRTCPEARIIADHGFNLLNSESMRLLAGLGIGQAAVSREAGLEDLRTLADHSPLPLEILAHGPVAGMVVDHCLIALHVSPSGRRDVCREPCRHVTFALRDQAGQVRPIVADQYCRNHLLTGHDLATLPVLEKLLFQQVASIRISGEFDTADFVAAMTRAYCLRLDQLHQGQMNGSGWHDAWDTLQRIGSRPLNLGAYPHSVVASRSTVEVMKGLAKA